MHKLGIIFLTFFMSFIAVSQVPEKAKETNLNVAIGIDEIVKFKYKFSTKVQIGNESLIRLSLFPSRREILFRGVKPGKTSITIRDSVGEVKDKFIVNITSDGNSNTVRELRDLLGNIEGLTISIKGGKVVVGGEIVVPDNMGRIITVLNKYPDVLLLVEYAKQTRVFIAREMQEAINTNGMKDVTVRVVNNDYWLEGVVNSEGKKKLAQTIAEYYQPANLDNLSLAAGGSRYKGTEKGKVANFVNVNVKKNPDPPPKLVKVSSQFVELSKDYLKVFAFKWAPFMSTESQISFGKNEAGGISTEEAGTLSGTISRLFPKLQSAKQAGYARVIQSAMAVTNNEKSIFIKKESKLNFAVGSGDGQEAKESSILFQMTTVPKIQNQENVELQNLNISVSLPNGTSANGSPQVSSNEIKTNLTVKSKDSAVIGGIMQSNSATNYDKNDPDSGAEATTDSDSGQAASLFNLLRSKSYTTQKSQFVVFITPEILDSASKGTEEIRKKFRKRER
jgi:pilus assembly protein CpaC